MHRLPADAVFPMQSIRYRRRHRSRRHGQAAAAPRVQTPASAVATTRPRRGSQRQRQHRRKQRRTAASATARTGFATRPQARRCSVVAMLSDPAITPLSNVSHTSPTISAHAALIRARRSSTRRTCAAAVAASASAEGATTTRKTSVPNSDTSAATCTPRSRATIMSLAAHPLFAHEAARQSREAGAPSSAAAAARHSPRTGDRSRPGRCPSARQALMSTSLTDLLPVTVKLLSCAA